MRVIVHNVHNLTAPWRAHELSNELSNIDIVIANGTMRRTAADKQCPIFAAYKSF